MSLPSVTFALVPYNNSARTVQRIEEVLWPTIVAHPDLTYELIVSDNSAIADPEHAKGNMRRGTRLLTVVDLRPELFGYAGAMPRQARSVSAARDAIYHVMNRGNCRMDVFQNELRFCRIRHDPGGG